MTLGDIALVVAILLRVWEMELQHAALYA